MGHDISYILRILLFRSTNEFVSFVDSISAKGSGDTAEDVIGGLRMVLNPSQIKWISDMYGTKVCRHNLYLGLRS